MAGKICFVLSESGRLTRVSVDTFNSLYEYNFSGRGEQRDNSEEFLAIIMNHILWQKAQQEAIEVQSKVREAYLAGDAKDKLLDAYDHALTNQEKKPKKLKAMIRFARIYMAWFKV